MEIEKDSELGILLMHCHLALGHAIASRAYKTLQPSWPMKDYGYLGNFTALTEFEKPTTATVEEKGDGEGGNDDDDDDDSDSDHETYRQRQKRLKYARMKRIRARELELNIARTAVVTAQNHFCAALDAAETYSTSDNDQVICLHAIGESFQFLGDSDGAMWHHTQQMQMAEELMSSQLLAQAFIDMGDMELRQARKQTFYKLQQAHFSKAKREYEQAVVHVEKCGLGQLNRTVRMRLHACLVGNGSRKWETIEIDTSKIDDHICLMRARQFCRRMLNIGMYKCFTMWKDGIQIQKEKALRLYQKICGKLVPRYFSTWCEFATKRIQRREQRKRTLMYRIRNRAVGVCFNALWEHAYQQRQIRHFMNRILLRSLLKPWENWKLYAQQAGNVKRMLAKRLSGMRDFCFDQWCDFVTMNQEEKEERARALLFRIQFRYVGLCFDGWKSVYMDSALKHRNDLLRAESLRADQEALAVSMVTQMACDAVEAYIKSHKRDIKRSAGLLRAQWNVRNKRAKGLHPRLRRKEELRMTFDLFDIDSSGAIDIGELRHLFGQLCYNLDAGTLERAMSEMDQDKSGRVEFSEWEKWNIEEDLFLRFPTPAKVKKTLFELLGLQSQHENHLKRAIIARIEMNVRKMVMVQFRKLRPPPYLCKRCLSPFVLQEELSRHLKRRSNANKGELLCESVHIKDENAGLAWQQAGTAADYALDYCKMEIPAVVHDCVSRLPVEDGSTLDEEEKEEKVSRKEQLMLDMEYDSDDERFLEEERLRVEKAAAEKKRADEELQRERDREDLLRKTAYLDLADSSGDDSF